MANIKLRGGELDAFNALGERGKPVYSLASQILAFLSHSALAKNHRDLARIFSHPEVNENGSHIDWFVREHGDVIAWSAATPEEQQKAYARLKLAEQQIQELSAKLAAAEGSDAALLQKILQWVLYYPDSSHVFLVNGEPVLTFWGFVLDGADRSLSPLHSLMPRAVAAIPVASPASPAATALAPVANPLVAEKVAPAVVVAKRPWWRWLLWLLLLLLLLALLGWLLRGCIPSLNTPSVALNGALPNVSLALNKDNSSLALPNGRGFELPNVGGAVPGLGQLPGGAAAAAGSAAPSAPTAGSEGGLPAAGAPQPPLAPSDPAAPELPQEPPALQPPQPQLPAEPGAASLPAEPAEPQFLQIPPELPDGKADFLNGGWQANSGIQDKETGVPLKLRYDFENGEGQAVLTGANGTECKAPVAAHVQSGRLQVAPSAQALCADGSAYDLPNVECSPDETDPSQACKGLYGDRVFPLYMRKPR